LAPSTASQNQQTAQIRHHSRSNKRTTATASKGSSNSQPQHAATTTTHATPPPKAPPPQAGSQRRQQTAASASAKILLMRPSVGQKLAAPLRFREHCLAALSRRYRQGLSLRVALGRVAAGNRRTGPNQRETSPPQTYKPQAQTLHQAAATSPQSPPQTKAPAADRSNNNGHRGLCSHVGCTCPRGKGDLLPENLKANDYTGTLPHRCQPQQSSRTPRRD